MLARFCKDLTRCIDTTGQDSAAHMLPDDGDTAPRGTVVVHVQAEAPHTSSCSAPEELDVTQTPTDQTPACTPEKNVWLINGDKASLWQLLLWWRHPCKPSWTPPAGSLPAYGAKCPS
jgi:hypothetical protein